MGVDARVLLCVVDRAALRDAIDSHAAAERERWARQGRSDEHDAMPAHARTAGLALSPLADGSVVLSTGLRWHDVPDGDFAMRSWLTAVFGARLSSIHDDPRGVFVFPDVAEPRATTYDAIVDELGSSGRFIDPAAPTEAERARHDAASSDAFAEFERAGRAAPEPIRFVDADPAAPPLDLAAFLRGLDRESAATREADLAFGQSPVAGGGSGRVATLVPDAVVRALGADVRGGDIDATTPLADGGAIVVFTLFSEEPAALCVAEALAQRNVDGATLPALPFFRESLVAELEGAASFEQARERLGERALWLPLLTLQQTVDAEHAAAERWLREGD